MLKIDLVLVANKDQLRTSLVRVQLNVTIICSNEHF